MPSAAGPVAVSPRDVVAACLPDPATLGERMHGKTCAGTWVRGTKDGTPREVYLYHVVDNQWSMAEYGCQAVVWQTADQPGRRPRTPRHRRLGRARASSGPEAFAGPPVPGSADRVRLPVGHARAVTAAVRSGPDASPDVRTRMLAP